MAAAPPVGLSNMSTAEMLRGLVVEKLTTAAQEIFATVERTVAGYEEQASGLRQEINRQRRLLELLAQPEIKVEPPGDQFPVCQPTGGGGEEEEKPSKLEPNVEDFGIRDVISYTEEEKKKKKEEEEKKKKKKKEEEEEKKKKKQEEKEKEAEEEESAEEPAQSTSLDQQDLRDPGHQIPSDERKGAPLKLRVGLMQTSKTDSLLEDGLKSPLQEVRCPRGLQEPDFLDLLRSTFPQLTGPFNAFTSDATGKSALFIRVKAAKKAQKDPKKPCPPQRTDRTAEEGSSAPSSASSSAPSPADERERCLSRTSRRKRRVETKEKEQKKKKAEEKKKKKEKKKKDDNLKPDKIGEQPRESKAERRKRRREKRKAVQSTSLVKEVLRDPGHQIPNAEMKPVMSPLQKRPRRVRQSDGSSDCSLASGAPPEKRGRSGGAALDPRPVLDPHAGPDSQACPESQAGPDSQADSPTDNGFKSPVQELRRPRGLPEPGFLDRLRSSCTRGPPFLRVHHCTRTGARAAPP